MEFHCANHPKRNAQARCVECGTHLCDPCRVKLERRNFCRTCVPAELRPKMKGRRSPVVAAVLSMVPGLGQMFSGSFFRGLVFGGSALAIASNALNVPHPVPLFLWVFNMFDAFSLAVERNANVTGTPISTSDRRQKQFWGLFAAALAGFSIFRTTVQPDVSPHLMWPVALGLYGMFLVTDRKESDVRTA